MDRFAVNQFGTLHETPPLPAAARDEPVRHVLWSLRCFSLTPPNGGRGRLVCGVLNAETIPGAICQTLLKGGVDAM
jgi:hypothetical protein